MENSQFGQDVARRLTGRWTTLHPFKYPKGGDGSLVNNLLPRQNAAKSVPQLQNNIWSGRLFFSWLTYGKVNRYSIADNKTRNSSRQTTNLFNKMGR